MTKRRTLKKWNSRLRKMGLPGIRPFLPRSWRNARRLSLWLNDRTDRVIRDVFLDESPLNKWFAVPWPERERARAELHRPPVDLFGLPAGPTPSREEQKALFDRYCDDARNQSVTEVPLTTPRNSPPLEE